MGLGVDAERTVGNEAKRCPVAPAVIAYPGRWSLRCSCVPCHQRGPRSDLHRRGGRGVSPRANGGERCYQRGGGSKRSNPRDDELEAGSPRAGLVGPPGEESPGAHQDVSLQLHFSFLCFSQLVCWRCLPSSRRHTDTGMLSMGPLKRLALSAWVFLLSPVPSSRALSRHHHGLRRNRQLSPRRGINHATATSLCRHRLGG
jgi:hypothetical protein